MAASEFTPGELPWRTEFGSGLHLLRHQKNDALLQELARIHVVDAIKRWEPRIRVTSVQVTASGTLGENVLAIRFRYRFASANVARVTIADVNERMTVPVGTERRGPTGRTPSQRPSSGAAE